MNTRKILIIIASTIILLLFGLISSISYNTGMNYGVTNAETIRTKRAKVAETHTKQIKTVLVTKVKNTTIKNQINSGAVKGVILFGFLEHETFYNISNLLDSNNTKIDLQCREGTRLFLIQAV